MTAEDNIERIEQVLQELDRQGEIVMASAVPYSISRYIYHHVVAALLENASQSDVLIECDLPYLLMKVVNHVQQIFKEDERSAKALVNDYYHRLLKRLTPQEVAELIYHETPFEIALLAYYCVRLKHSDCRDLDYLDWRQPFYSQR